MLPEFDKWPLVLQVLAYIGAAIAGAFVMFKGRKASPEHGDSGIELELKAIRADFALAIDAIKISIHDEMTVLKRLVEGYEHRLRDAERTIAVLEDRDDRDRRPRR